MSEKILPVSFTEKAWSEVKNIMANKKIPAEYGLRVGVHGAGCAGVSFMLGFDKIKEKDDEYELDGIKIFIEKKSLLYLVGQEVDFHEGADARGFFFQPEKK